MDESWKKYFLQSVEPYKKFKKMHIVDKTGAFKGMGFKKRYFYYV